jgi:hypothetical protein
MVWGAERLGSAHLGGDRQTPVFDVANPQDAPGLSRAYQFGKTVR